MSADRKYTDRDVRENNDFFLTAIDYLKDYEGEFDFLVDCKMLVAMERDLTVGMVRGILNCMRHDPRVTNLPEPMDTIGDHMAEIISIPRRAARRQRRDCDIEEFHGPHGRYGDLDADVYRLCGGKYPINRTDFQVDAILKVPYIAAKTGALVHKASEAWFMWRPMAHGWGWRYTGEGDPDFYVRTMCKYPRIIENGYLFDQEHLDDVLAEPIGSSAKTRSMCERCFR